MSDRSDDDGQIRQAGLDILASNADTRRKATVSARLARAALSRVVYYYWEASEWPKAEGVQTANTGYAHRGGPSGSRSAAYYELVIRDADSIRTILEARRAFRANYGAYDMGDDERGVVLRVAAYALRGVKVIGPWLKEKVRHDDAPMANADFEFPPGYSPVQGNIKVLAARLEHIEAEATRAANGADATPPATDL